jgi:hypothetical protein
MLKHHDAVQIFLSYIGHLGRLDTNRNDPICVEPPKVAKASTATWHCRRRCYRANLRKCNGPRFVSSREAPETTLEPFTNVVGSVDDNVGVGYVVFFVGAIAGNASVAPMGDYHRRQVPEQQHLL